jgi:hypothetical protein
MLNPATVEPRHSDFTLELIRRCRQSFVGNCPVRLRDGNVVKVSYADVQYESHGDFYDMSHFEAAHGEGVTYSWTLSGFNSYPQEHHLDIMELLPE